MAYHIKTTGEVISTIPAKLLRFTLAELQGFVGGYIEIVHRLYPMMIFDGTGKPIASIDKQVRVVNKEGLQVLDQRLLRRTAR